MRSIAHLKKKRGIFKADPKLNFCKGMHFLKYLKKKLLENKIKFSMYFEALSIKYKKKSKTYNELHFNGLGVNLTLVLNNQLVFYLFIVYVLIVILIFVPWCTPRPDLLQIVIIRLQWWWLKVYSSEELSQACAMCTQLIIWQENWQKLNRLNKLNKKVK